MLLEFFSLTTRAIYEFSKHLDSIHRNNNIEQIIIKITKKVNMFINVNVNVYIL